MGRPIKIFNNLDITDTNLRGEADAGSLKSPVNEVLPLWLVDCEIRKDGEGGTLGRLGIVDIYPLIRKDRISVY